MPRDKVEQYLDGANSCVIATLAYSISQKAFHIDTQQNHAHLNLEWIHAGEVLNDYLFIGAFTGSSIAEAFDKAQDFADFLEKNNVIVR